jgi:ABC-type nitrate/sulfonate/bicarbonate transport system ATPase subunit
VQGPVGSGKSTLCLALLGETYKLGGQVGVRGSAAYYAQQAWIQNMTLRDNILIGLSFEQDKYQRVLEACELQPDLAQLPVGDATEIGQKGVNLSGGQKARICLARACYADADVYVLDSPLAAVDTVVQKEIFNKCICGLLAAKTFVLVTHNPEIVTSEVANVKVEGGEHVRVTRGVLDRPRSVFVITELAQDGEETVKSKNESNDSGHLIVDEERVSGPRSKGVYWAYLEALGGIKVCLFVLLVQLLWQGFQISNDLWLSRWTGQSGGEKDHVLADTGYNMTVYALLGTG